MSEEWLEVQHRYANSVFQILTVEARHDSMRPYMAPSNRMSSGSGFLIDAKRGLIATNAHVVANAMTITGRIPKLGRRDIEIDPKSIIRQKDVAILQINPKDLKDVLEGEDINKMTMDIGDNMKLEETEKVLVIGYPLGERGIKYTTGIVSGFHADDETGFYTNMTEDSYKRDPSYIQITAPLNPGVSGGPLVNKKGQVVGINAAGRMFAQSIGYAIGIRTYLAVHNEMLRTTVPQIATFNLRWGALSSGVSQKLSGKIIDGIYVRKVLPDSVFNKLKPDDIITQFSYHDPFWGMENFSLKKYEKMEKNEGVEITGFIDKHGDITLCQGINSKDYGKKVKNCKNMLNRKISFPDFVDMIPYGNSIKVVFNRGGEWKTMTVDFKHVESDRIVGIYPYFEEYDYKIVAGMCITPLLLNQMAQVKQYSYKMFDESGESDEFMYQDHLLVSEVFPDTEAMRAKIQERTILVKVNGKNVDTMDSLDDALNLKTNDGLVTFIMQDGSRVDIDKKVMAKERKMIKREYGL